MNRKITIEYVAAVGDIVDVKNYRTRSGLYENAEVIDVTVRLYGKSDENNYHVSYTVCLLRKSAKGNPLFLTVGDRDNRIHYLYTP